MKLQYSIVVNVVIHISKSKGVAEMTSKTNEKGLSKGTSFTIRHVYSYREVPMFSLNLLKRTLRLFILNLRGGSRGRVQGMLPPAPIPEMKLSSSYIRIRF